MEFYKVKTESTGVGVKSSHQLFYAHDVGMVGICVFCKILLVLYKTYLITLVPHLSWFAPLSHFTLDFTVSQRDITQHYPATTVTIQA